MSFLSFLLGSRKKSASLAKDRRQPILINERRQGGVTPEKRPRLQNELVEAIYRYVKITPDDIQIKIDNKENLEVFEVKIEMTGEEKKAYPAQEIIAGAKFYYYSFARRWLGGLLHPPA